MGQSTEMVALVSMLFQTFLNPLKFLMEVMKVCTYVRINYVVVFSSSSVLILYDIKLCSSAHFLFYIVYI